MQPGGPSDAQIRKLIRQVEDLVSDTQDAVAERMAALDAVAATAQDRIRTSAEDRAKLHDMVDALIARVAVLEARRLTLHSAGAAIPLLTAGATTTVLLTWPAPFPDGNYVCGDPVVSAGLLGKVTGVIAAWNAAGCTVRLTTTVAVALGSMVEVTAARYS